MNTLDAGREKHALLSKFFKMIGVDEDIANIDGEGIEHHLHPQTLKKLSAIAKVESSVGEKVESNKT